METTPGTDARPAVISMTTAATCPVCKVKTGRAAKNYARLGAVYLRVIGQKTMQLCDVTLDGKKKKKIASRCKYDAS